VRARDALRLVDVELGGLAEQCARLADAHRTTVMAARTLLQQATPTTFGLKAAGWLVSVVEARRGLARATLPAQLGGAAGTLAAFGEQGLEVARLYADELGLPQAPLPWHSARGRVAELGAALAVAAGSAEKIALDVILLAQTEVGELRVPGGGTSSTMPHKRNPVQPVLARACALRVRGAVSVLLAAQAHEHERAAGAWHAEWTPLSDALALTGGAAAAMRETLAGLEVDVERMTANVRGEAMSEAERFAPDAHKPEDYLGAAGELVDRALELYRG
jgi:3-carboxy-cis,cis-muconate cycloisomerase